MYFEGLGTILKKLAIKLLRLLRGVMIENSPIFSRYWGQHLESVVGDVEVGNWGIAYFRLFRNLDNFLI